MGLRLVAESAEPCAEPGDRAAVVFIHGYTGARETWTSGQAYWPALLAGDSDLEDRLDIYSVVYDSFLFSGPPISEVVADLEKDLDALMGGNNDQIVDQCRLCRCNVGRGHVARAAS